MFTQLRGMYFPSETKAEGNVYHRQQSTRSTDRTNADHTKDLLQLHGETNKRKSLRH